MTASLDELPTLLTPPELAHLLRTTANSLAQDRYLGRGVPFVRHGRKVLYARTDVLAYLERNRAQRTDDPRGMSPPAVIPAPGSGGTTSPSKSQTPPAQRRRAGGS